MEENVAFILYSTPLTLLFDKTTFSDPDTGH